MLDAYIINAIREEEEKRERDFARRRIYLELPMPSLPPRDQKDDREEERGPVVIPFSPDIRDVEDDAA